MHPKRIGITGNIGSGKSTVAGIFERLGIPVYYADQAAKRLMTESPKVRNALIERFGADIYLPKTEASENTQRANENGTNCRSKVLEKSREAASPLSFSLDKKRLASIIFSDPAALKAINAIVHPAVAADSLAWHRGQQAVPYTLHEAAITFETGGEKALDAVIVVAAPEAIRLQRSMQRDGSSREQVLERMAQQWEEEKKIALADFVIYNDGIRLLLPQVLHIHQALLRNTTFTSVRFDRQDSSQSGIN